MTKEEHIERLLRARRWSDRSPSLEAFAAALEAGDRLEKCPLKAAGLTLITLNELPTFIIGPDGKCICTQTDECMNIDRKDGMRCTLEDLKQLSAEASSRRARQSGWYDD